MFVVVITQGPSLDEIYSVKCEECSQQYIGETARTLETRLKEHNRKVGNLTAIGVNKKERIVYRNTAKVGDLMCVSGNLGAAYLGLQILEREKQLYLDTPGIQPDLEEQQYLIGRQLKPEARFDMVELFEKNGLIPTSMIDVSDGLASEIFHICKPSLENLNTVTTKRHQNKRRR